ncbi:hypothetical protein FA95DRAFT_1597697 [Auriscalpium vulgare]|uniref:Uncharacterized protein n=1 Tax=Auriscalpium vulgare TaxID=40419 RepID=A0ACB8RJ24_9AGAM|nr:hypothetical protein FA95DRAFT_1597697 [Auriscalpium vulgare]
MDGQDKYSFGEISTADFWSSTLLSRLSQAETCSPEYTATLRDERAAVASLLLILDARINACAPVSRLPPEVMGTIFSYLLGQERHERIEVTGHVSRTVPWIRLTHVCRHWRQVFLNNAALWRHIVLPLPPKWSEVIVERSQLAPLVITCSPERKKKEKSPPVQLPVATLERVQHIDTWGYEGSHIGLAQLLRTPAPILEVAHLNNVAATGLFADSAPRLRVLKMSGEGDAFPWTTSFLPNLITLSLSSIYGSNTSVAQFIAGLRRLSRIQTLSLLDCLETFSSAAQLPTASQMVSLPSLRTLSISGALLGCVGFLRHVQAPDTFTLYVTTHAHRVSEFAVLYPFLAPPRGYGADPFRAIQFSTKGLCDIAVTARHADHGSPSRVFSFRWLLNRPDTLVDAIRALCEEMGVRELRSLSMDLGAGKNGPLLSPTMWLDEFGAAADLQELQATGTAGATLCTVLSASMEDGTWQRTGAARGDILWPRLSELKLEGVPLAHCFTRVDGVEEGDEAFGVSVGEVLLRELGRRQQRGAQLKKLKLIRCGATGQWLRKAEDLVGCVSARGDEDASQSEESGGA